MPTPTYAKAKKKVFSTHQVAHVWAQQTQDQGHNAGKSLFFEGPAIFSYRKSWPLACFVNDIVILNTEKRSLTTTQHLCSVRYAVNNRQTLGIDSAARLDAIVQAMQTDDDYQAKNMKKALLDLIKHLETSHLTAMKNFKFTPSTQPLEQVLIWAGSFAEAKHAAALFDIPYTAPDASDAIESIKAKHDDYNTPDKIKKREKARLIRVGKNIRASMLDLTPYVIDSPFYKEKAEQTIRDTFTLLPAQEAQDYFDHLRKLFAMREKDETFKLLHPNADVKNRKVASSYNWLRGADNDYYQSSPVLVRRKGKNLETSMYADVPWRHALRIFEFAQNCRINNVAWSSPPNKALNVGLFTVKKISSDGGITAGCHFIEFAQMLALAEKEAPHLVKNRYPVPMCI